MKNKKRIRLNQTGFGHHIVLPILVVLLVVAVGVRVMIASHAAATQHFNVTSYGATGNGTTDDSSAFQNAINAAGAAGGGVVEVPSPKVSYFINHQITLLANVKIVGAGSATTEITGGVPSGYVLIGGSKAAPLSNIGISGLDIDLNYLANAGGIRIQYVNGLKLNDVQVNNVNQWGVVVGVANGTDTTIENKNIVINNCSFSGLNNTLEQILLFNSSNVTVENSKFSNITNPAGTSIGLYQVMNNVKIDSNTFNLPSGRGSYYSRSVNNVTYANNVFIGQGGSSNDGIIGANLSDNGSFGQRVANNYNFQDNTFKNLTVGLQVGSLDGAQINRNYFGNNINALVINDGNSGTGAYYPAKSIDINANVFTDNNSTNNFYALHPAILFESNGGLTTDATDIYVQQNQFENDQTTKTQRYPIGFDGGYSNGTQVDTEWDKLTILSNDLAADTTNGGTSLTFADGARLGPNTLIYQNTNYSGTPAQNTTGSGVSGTIDINGSAYSGNIHISSADTPKDTLVPASTGAQGQFYFLLNPGSYIIYTDLNGDNIERSSFTVNKNELTNLGTI